MKNTITGLLFLPFALFFWVLITLLFTAGRLARRTGPLPRRISRRS